MAYKFDIILHILKPIWFLPELSQFRVLKAAINYLQEGSSDALEETEDVAFRMLLPMLDEERDKELKRVEAYRRNGHNGGRGKTKKTKAVILVSDKEISSSPFPTPLTSSPKETNNLSNNNNAREDRVSWVEDREKSYKERFLAQGSAMAAARVTGKRAQELLQMLDAFDAKCQLGDFGHKDFGHFNNHFLQFVKNPENSISNGNDNRTADTRRSAGVSSAEDISEPF